MRAEMHLQFLEDDQDLEIKACCSPETSSSDFLTAGVYHWS